MSFDKQADAALLAQIRGALNNVTSVLSALDLLKGSKRSGNGRQIRCPWHNENSPSCSVTIGDGRTLRAHCFSCGVTGDVLALIAVVYGWNIRTDFPKVLGRAADMAGIAIPDRAPEAAPAPIVREETIEPPATTATIEEEAHLALALARLADACPVAADTRMSDGLAARFLLDEAVRAGWCVLPRRGTEALLAAPTFAALRPILLRDDAVGRPTLLFRDHRLVIPWRSPDGAAWSFQRRFAPHTGLEDPKVLGQKVGKYIWPVARAYRPATPWAYGVDHYSASDRATREVWLVEGAPDVHSVRALNELGVLSKKQETRPLTCLGVPGVTALKTFLPTLVRFLKGRVVVVATDADRAGEAAKEAWKAAIEAAVAVKEVRFVTPPGHDWNELLKSLR